MKRGRVVAAAAVTLVLTGYSAGGGTAAEVDGAAEPVTLHLALDQDMATLLPMDSNIDNNIWVLDVVYDGLVRYDPFPATRPTSRASTSTFDRCATRRTSARIRRTIARRHTTGQRRGR